MAITALGPAMAGMVIAAISWPLLGLGESSFLEVISVAAGMLALAPLVAIYTLPLAVLVGAWAPRLGYAGWGVALSAGLCAPTLLGGLFQVLEPTTGSIGVGLLLTPFVLVHALVMWVATRWLCPETLLDPGQ